MHKVSLIFSCRVALSMSVTTKCITVLLNTKALLLLYYLSTHRLLKAARNIFVLFFIVVCKNCFAKYRFYTTRVCNVRITRSQVKYFWCCSGATDSRTAAAATATSTDASVSPTAMWIVIVSGVLLLTVGIAVVIVVIRRRRMNTRRG